MSTNGAQRCSKQHEELCFGSRSLFSGTFGKIPAKILRIPKKLPAPCRTTTDLGIFGTVLGIFGVAFMRTLFLLCTRGRYAVRDVSDRELQTEQIRYSADLLVF